MPELPEVETTVRGLARVLDGKRVARVQVRRGDLRRAFPADLGQRLTGATVTGLGRRAKYGTIATDRGDTMIFHLGMSGRWRIDPDAPAADIQWHFVPAILEDHGRVAVKGHGFSAHVCVLRPESRGTVRLTSTDAAVAPLIGLPPRAWPALHRVMVNTSVTKVVRGQRGTSLISFNDHGHLEGVPGLQITYR